MTQSQALKRLYNGIMNDPSIRRYSLGWKDIVSRIETKYKTIERTDESFTENMLLEALEVTSGNLKRDIQAFAKELSFSLETIGEKITYKGTQRSPFGMWS